MTVHSLWPGFIKIRYVVSTFTHYMTLPVSPEAGWTVGSMPNLVPNAGSSVSMATAIAGLMTVVRPFFSNTCEFVDAEAWLYPSSGSDPVWVYTHPIGLQGTHATANAGYLQGVYSFRTYAGGLYRMYLMEISGAIAANSRDSYPFGSTLSQNLTNYLKGNDGWIIGRDGGKLVVPLFFTTKYNDALRKRRMNL